MSNKQKLYGIPDYELYKSQKSSNKREVSRITMACEI